MGKGPKAQVLEILAALQGPQVQAEVLRAVAELSRNTIILETHVGEEGIDRGHQGPLPIPLPPVEWNGGSPPPPRDLFWAFKASPLKRGLEVWTSSPDFTLLAGFPSDKLIKGGNNLCPAPLPTTCLRSSNALRNRLAQS